MSSDMRDLMTSIHLPEQAVQGYADYGKKTSAEMIAAYRAIAREKKFEAEAILAAVDEDFRIDTYRGIHAQRDRKIIQEGKAPIELPQRFCDEHSAQAASDATGDSN